MRSDRPVDERELYTSYDKPFNLNKVGVPCQNNSLNAGPKYTMPVDAPAQSSSIAELCLKDLYATAHKLEDLSIQLVSKLSPVCKSDDTERHVEDTQVGKEYPAYFTELRSIRWNLDFTAARLISLLDRCEL